jgi:hypothetical protein
MKKQTTAASVAGLALTMLLLSPAAAAGQATISARATVSQALTVNAGSNLEFGQVVPGFSKTIDPADATAGTFSLSGAPGAELSVEFTALPDNLSDGVNLLPITYAGVQNTANDPITGALVFVPSLGTTSNLSAAGELFIFLGGTVDASGSPPAGLYTGTITLTGAYTGS